MRLNVNNKALCWKGEESEAVYTASGFTHLQTHLGWRDGFASLRENEIHNEITRGIHHTSYTIE